MMLDKTYGLYLEVQDEFRTMEADSLERMNLGMHIEEQTSDGGKETTALDILKFLSTARSNLPISQYIRSKKHLELVEEHLQTTRLSRQMRSSGLRKSGGVRISKPSKGKKNVCFEETKSEVVETEPYEPEENDPEEDSEEEHMMAQGVTRWDQVDMKEDMEFFSIQN